jgi:hypothetical protein
VAKRFEDEDWSGAYFHNVDFSGARVQEGNFDGASFSGYAGSLKVNGFEVWPLIEAELIRIHPEYAHFQSPPKDPDACRRATGLVLAQLDETTKRAGALPDERRRERVDDEWSALETMRHLVYVIDVWLRTVIRGESDALDPIGLPNTAGPAIDPDLDPSFEIVLAAWQNRADLVRTYVDRVDSDELDRPPAGPDFEPSIRDALWVLLYELWWHNHYMTRDLDALESS